MNTHVDSFFFSHAQSIELEQAFRSMRVFWRKNEQMLNDSFLFQIEKSLGILS